MTTFRFPFGNYAATGVDESGNYPYINVEQTESGHFFMMDDTPGNESIRIQHGKSFGENQTYWVMEPNGSTKQVTAGNNFTVIVNNNEITIGGVCSIVVKADAKLDVWGTVYASVGENLRATVNGDANVVVEGGLDVVAGGDINITAGSPTSILPPNINLITGGTVNVTGDLRVSGTIMGGSSIMATTYLTAGGKCFTMGGFETLGGINVGAVYPGMTTYDMGGLAPPGCITASGTVNAPNFLGITAAIGVVKTISVFDYHGALALLRMKYNMHSHPDAGGNTLPDV